MLSSRQYQAFAAWRTYSLDMLTWIKSTAQTDVDMIKLQESLGTTYGDFMKIAEELPNQE